MSDATPAPTPTRPYTQKISIDALYVDPFFADLFLQDKTIIAGLVAEMRKPGGFDPYRPIDVWKNARGRGKHTVLEGHQRLAAAKQAKLEEVYVAYREFATRVEALLWAAQQQGLRRNVSREIQCLGLLRKLQDEPGFANATTAALATQLGFARPTIDRARLLLRYGTEAEILAVLEGTHGLREAYRLLNERRRKSKQEDERPKVRKGQKRIPVLTNLRNALMHALDGGLLDLPEAIRHAKWLLDFLEGRAPDTPDADEDEETADEMPEVATDD